jgi:hypothetical protein
MTDLQELAEIESLKKVMAKYSRFGDTQNWVEFRTLFVEDSVFSFEAMPRANPDAPQAATIQGLDTFIGGMAEMLKGAQTCHRMYLPEITITGPGTAKSTWGIHDLVKTQNCIFNGYGHIHQNYVKVNGEWKWLWHTLRGCRVVSVRVGRGGGAGRSWLVRTFVS